MVQRLNIITMQDFITVDQKNSKRLLRCSNFFQDEVCRLPFVGRIVGPSTKSTFAILQNFV